MAQVGHRVDYLAGFCCPVGGLAAGKPRVLCHENQIYLSNGTEYVYVYDQEGRLMKAVYRFPDQIWHVELLPLHHQLYILCAGVGIYCVSLDYQKRLVKQTDGEESDCFSSIFPMGCDACTLPDATLCTFTLLNDVLVTLSQVREKWCMNLHKLPGPEGQEKLPYQPVSHVDITTSTSNDGDMSLAHFLPVLCCASAPGASEHWEGLRHSGGFVLEEPLFSLLFGVDAAMLDSPMILCGFPDGQLCSVPLKALNSPGDHGWEDSPVKILHHLEEPVVFIGALRTERKSPDVEEHPAYGGLGCDCVVALGHYGKMVAIKASQGEEVKVPELREYYLQGPVLCAACSGGSCMYYSTHSDIYAVDLDSNTPEAEKVEAPAGTLPSAVSPASLSICSVVALSLSSRESEGESELLALSAKGRLMTCGLCSPDDTQPLKMNADKAGQRIKELLSGIGHVSERVSSLKKAVDQKNQALTCLNQVMNVSAALLSSQNGPKPITCTIAAHWSHMLVQDTLTISCILENSSECSLERGWTFCVQLFANSCDFEETTSDSATTYTFPIDQLLPGNKTEVTLPVSPAEGSKLNLPFTVSCSLYYSLQEILGTVSESTELLDDLFSDDSPGLALDREGICLPLREDIIDLLQCLRLDDNKGVSEASPPAMAISVPGDPVENFLKLSLKSMEENDELVPKGLSIIDENYLAPTVASIKVSSELLRTSLKDFCEEVSLCCIVLRWLLAENAEADALRSQEVAVMQGLAPDGGKVQLNIREVTVSDLSPAGPIQAVEIVIQGSPLVNMCQLHHAVVRRIQALILEQAAQDSSPPDIRVQYLQQIQANHEMLLKEAQSLRDNLCLGNDSDATVEKLLQVYQQLRNPSLVVL
ncbi:Fanconi anemia core complex-associated protein 100 isoform X1 [Ahaetulla prasina]|uniref:Fanconi anemia core complex-associated protein 100 isoform X1 n=2 Tax=Ahaetulla prasina TaxID=499056 RepID=UPI002647C727|nr:Fanconi anemia core complex-associated protein 100 isoform X1 [Ahaetulla prasina]XP_058022306.1 Fanconi anemia core complex-associated protein 100 isoform X1 [Ahaetulla prasina]XP_058022307.1 Fanconi anemia core complex-associated protein 100 isoform X1 [Ahaetulla prasina]